MREILFRGKRVDNGEWVEGGILQTENWASIFVCKDYQGSLNEAPYSDVEEIDVIPETVGQFTGLLDKNGMKIFEGDIVSNDLERPYNIIVFRDGCFMFNCNDGGQDYYDIMLPILRIEHTRYEYGEVIGNIYDNPEFVKEK